MGIIRALIEAGIPVDMIGGTSIGAFMSALYAEERSYNQMRIKARQWAMVSTGNAELLPWECSAPSLGNAEFCSEAQQGMSRKVQPPEIQCLCHRTSPAWQ